MKRIVTTFLFISLFLCVYARGNAAESQIQLVRNATLLIDYAGHHILLDPMLSPKGAIGSVRGKVKTPMVELPMKVDEITKGIDFVLVTHAHVDHFDPTAAAVLDKSLKLFGQQADEQYFLNCNFWNAEAIADSVVYDGITIIRTDAQHGTGRMLKNMGNASGFVLKASGHPTLYIIGDGVWTQGIADNIGRYNPDYIVVNSGGAVMPGGYDATPIIMDERQVMALIQESGNAKIIAVHMDAVDHCLTTRAVLRKEAKKMKIGNDKLLIPEDGEIISLSK